MFHSFILKASIILKLHNSFHNNSQMLLVLCFAIRPNREAYGFIFYVLNVPLQTLHPVTTEDSIAGL